MLYALTFLFGVALGAIALYVILLEWQRRLSGERRELESMREELKHARSRIEDLQVALRRDRRELDERVVSYDELAGENDILKRDLQNVDVHLRKLHMDRDAQREQQAALAERVQQLGSRYLSENVKWISKSLTSNNYVQSKKNLGKVIERCRGIGLDVAADEEARLREELKQEYERVVRQEFAKEEQNRIRQQIREEQQLQREIDAELKRLENERAAIQAALQQALADAKEEHTEEVDRLRARLVEAEERTRRTKSRAELTKAGHIYVISNIGSFGDRVYKVGMTRRLEPQDRIKELGDASVPFPFDVHMMISSDNAPHLEYALHRALHTRRINKVNPRKEFFRTDLDEIRMIVEREHGTVDYVAEPEALDYRQSIEASEDDVEYVDQLYERVHKDNEPGTSAAS